MNATDIKLMKLYKEYFPFLPKERERLRFYSDEYEQEGNIRLLFGYFRCEPKEVDNFTLTDMIYVKTSDDRHDLLDSTLLIENLKENQMKYGVEDLSYYRDDIDSININRRINGNRKNNYGYIALNPFGNKPQNITEKEREFLMKQINILQPDAIIISESIDERSLSPSEDLDVEKYRKVFGRDIIFYPIPFTSAFIKKYDNNYDYTSHLSLIEGVKQINTKIYIYKCWNCDRIDYIDDLLQIIANHIIRNTKKHK